MIHIGGDADFAAAFTVSRETVARLRTYADLLRRWQPTINLVGPATLADVWHRHFADSAQLLALAPAGALRWLDLGSGAGLPGIVAGLMLAERPGSSALIMIESDVRKAAFLREAVRETGLGQLQRVDIVVERIEAAANLRRVGNVDVVSARALAPLDRLLGLCRPYFGTKTVGLLPKGRGVGAELEAARQIWEFKADVVPSRTDGDGRIIVVRDLTTRENPIQVRDT